MGLFVVVWFAMLVLLLLLAAPLFVVAWKRDRLPTAAKFALTAVVLAVFGATLAVTSDRLVRQCNDAGYADCIDSGAVGLQLLFVGLYTIAAWWAAHTIYND